VEVIAHRGASAYAPENTLEAFKLARKQGADYFELDVRLCKTGRAVVMHDDTVDRTTDGFGKVSKLTLTQLRKLDVGGWKGAKPTGQPVPTLREALESCGKDFGCYIEIKGGPEPKLHAPTQGQRNKRFDAEFLASVDNHATVKLVRAVIADVRSAREQKHVVIQSFSAIACCATKIIAPRLRVELLVSKLQAGTMIRSLRLSRFFGFAGINTNFKNLTREHLTELKAAGLSCAAYTVNEPDDMRRLIDWGVDGIITDRPDVCRAILRE
jgi:glycerophosphoryl diester phosphodiesterase